MTQAVFLPWMQSDLSLCLPDEDLREFGIRMANQFQ